MQERGRIQERMVADIAILDPETIRDNATYARATAPTTGIRCVIVNGIVVIEDPEVLASVLPSQPVRFPVESDGPFEPLDRAS